MAKMNYSQFFDFGDGPSLKTGTRRVFGDWSANQTSVPYQYVDSGSQDLEAAQAFDKIMSRADAESQSYVDQLKGIYDGYGQYAKEYGDKAQPIMDALSGDIKGMDRYMKRYDQVLGEIQPTMMDGIQLDPSATRTREEYTGNVASSFGKQREQLNQSMASQGLNPFANKGADRQLRLGEAAATSSAANSAYKDWRTQYNQDVQAKQNAQATYAGLVGQSGKYLGNIMESRRGMLDANANITNVKLGAAQAKASGVENLLSLAENRRQEQLSLGQQQQANKRLNNDISQQLDAKLTAWDRKAANGRTGDDLGIYGSLG